MEHMATASAMRGGVTDHSLHAVLTGTSSLCNFIVIPGWCAKHQIRNLEVPGSRAARPGTTSQIEERFS
jgi:hypothetical protein